MKKLLVPVCILFAQAAQSQTTSSVPPRPKLVVGIIVDQMRQEYLYRFAPKFGEGGFHRLVNEGFMLSNAHYNYVPTYTGPGHASVYTGTTPAAHGIIGNDWFDKRQDKMVNCVEDEKQKPIGSQTGNGDVSPWRMLPSTVTDELELATQRRTKTIGISLKDRGAVLPAGHTPDGAFWYDGTTGKFITSTYYKSALPVWVDQFNARKLPDAYLDQTWNTVYPIEQYKESGPDNTPYEVAPKGKDNPVFPYDLKALRKTNGEHELLPSTPFGNDLLTQLALAAIAGEDMGKDEWTDFLAISYSSPDIIGHAFGPNAIEVEDTYIRLDKNIEEILQTLDRTVGKGAYLVFLTADHGVADVPEYLKDIKILSTAHEPDKSYEKPLKEYLASYFPGKEIIKKISNGQVFFDHSLFNADPKSSGIEYMVVSELVKNYLLGLAGVAEVYTRQSIMATDFSAGGTAGMIKRGFHTVQSGDIAVVLAPGWIPGFGTKGSSHGSGYPYDTHVPILFYGFGVAHGTTAAYHPITDIAPTLSVLLKVKFPSAATGQPIGELLK